eukprot:scaffold121957_cov28-Tisochrysis_lutea.AAC.4
MGRSRAAAHPRVVPDVSCRGGTASRPQAQVISPRPRALAGRGCTGARWRDDAAQPSRRGANDALQRVGDTPRGRTLGGRCRGAARASTPTRPRRRQ